MDELDRYYKLSVKRTTESPLREIKLRCSSFPYCGLRHYFLEKNPSTEINFGHSYFTGVGTQVHEIIQRYMGLGGQILGDWLCPSCNYFRELRTYSNCPVCDSEMSYVELSIEWKNISGHVDGVFVSSSGDMYVIDYKTSSSDIINKFKTTKSGLPYFHNTVQIRAYCSLLEQTHGLKISGYALIYMSRDNPIDKYVICTKSVNSNGKLRMLDTLNLWNKTYIKVKSNNLSWLIENRPCKTPDFYYKYYHAFDGCPLGVSGVCFNEKKLLEVLND